MVSRSVEGHEPHGQGQKKDIDLGLGVENARCDQSVSYAPGPASFTSNSRRFV